MGWIILFLSVLGVLVGVAFLSAQSFVVGGILILFFGFALFGLKQVEQEKRAVVQLFGKYCMTLKPGLQWVAPLGIMRIRAMVSTWEIALPLFDESMKIDFVDGSAQPKNAEVFIKMKSPDRAYGVDPGEEKRNGAYRAIYEIANWRTSIRDLIENAVRSYLNRLTIDEAISMAKAGFDLANYDSNVGLPSSELQKIEKSLARWGFDLIRITVGDFELEPELVEARGKIQIRRKESEAAQYLKVQRARETMGSLIQMMAESTGKEASQIQEEISRSPKLKKEMRKISEDLVTRRMSIDGKAFTDIRVAGGGDLGEVLMAIITAIKKA